MEDNSNGGHRSAGSADSYIGSRISLTSKSEIRYEGILYSIDTENSNIALQDVMSFGTEGRKKDGPQIPRSDKVYDFIIFRGSDIKDLQVISSPSTQSVPTPHNDPAIISQSQYPQHAAPMAPRFGSSTSGNMGDRAPPAPYQTMSQGNFQSAMPGSMYQPWPGLPQTMTPSVNGGLGMPMYWPGYYPPHMQQPPQKPHAPLIPPLPITSTLQESTPPTSSESNIVTTATTTTTTATASLDLLSSISPSTIMPASSLPPLFDAHLASNASLDLNALLPPSNILSSLSSSSSSPPSSSLVSHLANQFITSSVPLSLGFPSSSSSSSSSSVIPTPTPTPTPTPMPLLATPRMLQTGVLPSPVKNAEQISIESSTSTPVPTAPLTTSQATSQTQTFNQEPLLPLPAVVTTQERRYRQGNGVVLHSNYVRRGRGRGRGNVVASYQAKRFTEEFDFDAMNAKFKKFGALDELNDKADGEECEDVGSNDDDDDDEAQYKLKNSNMPESPKKPIYVKDDFFDSLSCDALDRAASTERVKMSQLRKIDTETFGSFSSRYRGGQGGRGYGYRGGSRRGGSYHGGRSWGGIGRGNVYGRRG